VRKKSYFKEEPGAPAPWTYSVQRRARFGEVDAMAVMWHGHYAVLFEEASTELRRECGLTYEAFFEAGLRAPVVQFNVDYHHSLFLDQLFTITAALVWTEAARLNITYEIRRADGVLAASGYTVQLFTSAATGETCFTVPELLQRCHEKWKARKTS